MAAFGITVLKNNVPWGPFTRAQIDDGLARRDFTVQYLAHAPGLKEWLPLGEVLDYVDRDEGPRMPLLPPVPGPRDMPPVPPVPPVPETPVMMAEPAKPISIPEPPPTRPPILPASIPRAPEQPSTPALPVPPEAKPEIRLIPAASLLRGIAFLIDIAILFLPVVVLFILGSLSIWIPSFWNHASAQTRMEDWDLLKLNMGRMAWLVFIGFGWLYVAGFECSPSQATIGKRWVGIKVTDEHGERLSFLRATCRYAAKYLSALPCFLGFIMALFSSRGLALHDRLTDTQVVRG